MSVDRSSRNTIAMTLAWWYVRRLIRKRGTAAVAGLMAGEGLSLSGRQPQKRHVLRTLFVLGLVAGAGFVWWRRRDGGGGDDWGGWEPVVPEAPLPAEPATPPEPLVTDPIAT
jgi:hypothetical protein